MSVPRWLTLKWVMAVTWCCVLAGRGEADAADLIILQLTDPYVYEAGNRCAVDNGCFVASLTEELEGVDALGEFFESRTHYNTLTSGAEVVFSTRDYGNGIQVFRQDFPDGLQGTSMGNKDAVSTSFPRILLPGPSEAPDLRYATPGGNMVGWTDYSQGSVATELDSFRDGEDGGLVILFSGEGEGENVTSVVISSLTNPMATNVMLDKSNLTLEWGVQGQAESIPAGYSAEVIAYSGIEGIVRNIMAWGGAMQTYHATQKMEDPSAEVVNYYTNNGAAHYYNPLPYDNYHDAMMSVYNYSVANDLPIKRLELDSWFYYKGAGDGVKNWTEDLSLLPGGIASLYDETGWPTVAHNRYFSSDTDYAQQNGGPYLFTVDEESEKALPLEKVFWDDLFATTVPWGLQVYLQDWLDETYMYTSALHTNLTLGSKWLNDMGEAAADRGLNIMYCMSFIRHILHSVSLPAVTSARVSADYLVRLNQWQIGFTSLVAHALGLRPFKDVFWTSHENVNEVYVDCEMVLLDPELPLQGITRSGLTCADWNGEYDLDGAMCRNPDKDVAPWCYTNAEHTERDYCDNKCRAATEEGNPDLQAAVSTLSAGPYGVGDLAENLNISLIRKSCSSDGRLLQPSKPATVVDGYFYSLRDMWSTYSDISSIYFGIIFLAQVGSVHTVTPWELNLESAFVNETLVFSNYPEDLGYSSLVSNQEAFDLPTCGGSLKFCIMYTTPGIPTEGGDLFILGELDKWVPVSPDRIQDLEIIPSNSQPSLASTVLLTVRGVEGEAVTLFFTGAEDFTITCDYLQDGVMTADTQARTCES